MSFISQLDTIFRQLRQRLDLRDYQTEPVYIPSVIQPVMEIGELIGDDLINPLVTISITGTGVKTLLTVPANENAIIRGIRIYASSGTWTIDEVSINDGSNGYVFIKQTADPEVTSGIISNPIRMKEGWLLQVNIKTYAVTGNLSAQIFYRREQIS